MLFHLFHCSKSDNRAKNHVIKRSRYKLHYAHWCRVAGRALTHFPLQAIRSWKNKIPMAAYTLVELSNTGSSVCSWALGSSIFKRHQMPTKLQRATRKNIVSVKRQDNSPLLYQL
uniref:Uncharacterized protein n=1 Tax=Parascaris univalens TaxID=6257 RepID=A0A915BVT9_PARUN